MVALASRVRVNSINSRSTYVSFSSSTVTAVTSVAVIVSMPEAAAAVRPQNRNSSNSVTAVTLAVIIVSISEAAEAVWLQ